MWRIRVRKLPLLGCHREGAKLDKIHIDMAMLRTACLYVSQCCPCPDEGLGRVWRHSGDKEDYLRADVLAMAPLVRHGYIQQAS